MSWLWVLVLVSLGLAPVLSRMLPLAPSTERLEEVIERFGLKRMNSFQASWAGENAWIGKVADLPVVLRLKRATLYRSSSPEAFEPTLAAEGASEGVDERAVVITHLRINAARSIPSSVSMTLDLGREQLVMGDQALATLLFDSALRMVMFRGDKLHIDRGGIEFESPLYLYDGRSLVDLINVLLTIPDRIPRSEGELRSKLLEMAKTELDVSARVGAIEVLRQRFPGSEEAEAGLAAGLADEQPQVRFRVSRLAGDRGIAILEALAHDPLVDPELRERSALALTGRLSDEALIPFLEQMFQELRPEALPLLVRQAAARRAKALGAPIAALAQNADEALALAICEALGDLRAEVGEDVLIRLLSHEDEVVQIAAADALGKLRSLRAVPELRKAVKGFLTGSELRLSVQAALDMILEDRAHKGGLSLSEEGTESGALSLPDGEAGALSEARSTYVDLFVYGTLLFGEPEHHRLGEVVQREDDATIAGYELWDLGEFPAMSAGGKTAVKGELCRIDRLRLVDLDVYEGCPGRYTREVVNLVSGRTALTYLLEGERPDAATRIISGDWRRR